MTTIETAGGDAPVVISQADVRQARLAASVARIRRSEGFDVERALHWAGSILFPTGIIVILLGWYGAAHTSYDFEQTPYLISGGVLGASLTIVGGFLYFGYWIARLVQESRRERTELADLLTRLDNRLATIEAVATGTLPGAATSARAPNTNGGSAVVALVATATGSLVHRPDCPLVAGKVGLRSIDPDQPGLKPCKVCDPFGEAATDEPPAPPAARRTRPLRA
jgi:hypothetical protein